MPTKADELKERLLELGERMNGLREKPVEERSPNWSADIRTTRDEIYALDGELQVEEAVARSSGPAVGTQLQRVPEYRSPGELFTTHPDFEAWMHRGFRGESPALDVERRTLVDTVVGSEGGVLLPKGQPFIAPGGMSRRRLFLRDLIAGGTTTLSSVPYVRELNAIALEGGASAVAEASAKPEVQMSFESDDAPVRTIAAWVPVTRQAIEDLPTMRSYIDARLGYMVQIRDEEELLSGPGTGARIKGIRTFTQVQTQSFVTDKITSIGRAIAKIELVDGEADGVAINPTEFWTMVTTRSSSQFDDANAASGPGSPYSGAPPMNLWGLPAVRTRSMPTNEALVGAFRMGAQVFDREGVTIRVTDSHAALFISNQLVILAEERVALAVHRPDFFVKVTLS